jgi:hypothetical protein
MDMEVIKLKKNGKVEMEFTQTEWFLLKQIRRAFWPKIPVAQTAVRLLEISVGHRRAPWHYSSVPEAVRRFRYEVRCQLAQQYPGEKL